MRIQFVPLLISLALSSTLIYAAEAAQPQPSLSIQREGGRVYLAQGTDRLLIEDSQQPMYSCWGARSIHTASGYQVELPPREGSGQLGVSSKDGKVIGTIPLNDYVRKWLLQDDLWGGHEAANELRYMAGSFFLTCATPSGDDVLAVLSIYSTTQSDEHVLAQQLIRIRMVPKLEITPLRLLPGGDYTSSRTPPPRLFAVGKKLLLFSSLNGDPATELTEITSDGKPIRRVVRLPGMLPAGLLNKRWLFLWKDEPWKNDSSKDRYPLYIYDLKQHKLTRFDGWSGYTGSVYIPADGNRVLLYWQKNHTDTSTHTYVVTIPSGSSINIPNPSGYGAQYLWHNMVIRREDREVAIYDAGTGKLIERIPL